MTQRPPGTRRATGLALMAAGILCMLLFIVSSLGEVTTSVARVGSVVFIAGIAALAAGALFYVSARSGIS